MARRRGNPPASPPPDGLFDASGQLPVDLGGEPKPHYLGHRQRLRERLLAAGAGALPDYELLEFLLFAAQPRGDLKPLAKDLLRRFGSLAAVLSAERPALAAVPGVGDAAIAALMATREAGLRLARAELVDRPVLGSWQKVIDYCTASMAFNTIEEFHLLFLDRKNAVIADERQQRGTVDHTPVYTREVVKRALELGASALIMVHNHPSGDPTPSKADIATTREVAKAAALFNVTLHDHIIIGRGRHASLKSLGLL
jgi:DNA repair protein RadC